MTKALAVAGDKYATYLCDKCDKPVGADGMVTLTSVKPVLVWQSYCASCWEPRQRPSA